MSTIKDQAPSFDTMVENILTLFHAADDVAIFEGTHWYDQARTFAAELAATHGVSVDVAACVISAHSANCAWADNMRRAIAHLSGTPKGMGRSIAMADNAIQNAKDGLSPFDAIVGPKINPFARAVAGDLYAVATDRWAQRAAFDTLDDTTSNRWIKRNGMRASMIDAYRKAAFIVGVEPAVMQAIVWVVVRGSAD